MNTLIRSTLCVLLLGILNLPAATHYVSVQSLNPTPPYLTWDSAAINIQDAVDAAQPGETLLVTNGFYPGLVTIGKQLTLVSVNGPLVTILDGVRTNRCLFLSSLTNQTCLSGFTFTNGTSPSIPSAGLWDGGAVYSYARNIWLTNCILSGNCASNAGAAYGARLYNCIVSGNTATNTGGGVQACELYNCTVVGNMAGARGGGAFLSALHNSIVYYNSAPSGPNYDIPWGATNCCTTPNPPGENNITAEPLFVDYAARNLHLQPGSPCIDAGTGGWLHSVTDLDGGPRVVGAAVDIGAYEYQVSGPPNIAIQPVDQGAYVGGSVTFSASAFGSPPLSWQWRREGVPIPDATRSSLTLSALTTDKAGRYSVLVTNLLGSATSQDAVLTVLDAEPTFSQQPASQDAYVGNDVTLTANAVGSLPLFWQWRFNENPIAHATNASLSLTSVALDRSGNYSVVVTNALGSATSQVAVLTVRLFGNPPTITMQPVSQTVYVGSNVTLSVGATGNWPFTYQWRSNNVPIPYATWSVLTLPSITMDQAANYSAVVGNSGGMATSQVAVITVLDAVPTLTLQPQTQETIAGLTVTFTASAKGSLPMLPQWLFNGEEIRDGTNWTLTLPSVTIDQAGVYSVLVSNALGTVASDDAVLLVRLPDVRYVWQGSPNPVPPHKTWETAAHTIQDAVDAAVTGDDVVVTNGIYATGGKPFDMSNTTTNRVLIDKEITVRSVNGPGVTVIQGYQVPVTTNGDAAVRCVYLSAAAKLVGFTVTNGATSASPDPWSYPASGGGIFAEWGGRVTNCRIIGNSAQANGGGAYLAALNNCLVVSNTAGSYGGGAYLGTLTNCTVVGNSAPNGSAGMYASSAYNSILYYNNGGNWTGSKGSFIAYCCTVPEVWVFGWQNISAEPRFVDLANGDFHLQPDSPCINSGNNANVTSTVDLEGSPRIAGGRIDMGAYEYPDPGSGLPFSWLQQYGFATDGSADLADPDSDGLNNTQEYICGTNPTNAASALRLVSVVRNPTSVAVSWESIYGIYYTLERSTNFCVDFAAQRTNAPLATVYGQTGTTTFNDTNAPPAGTSFYRVGVKQP